jgi:flagellar assembly factor FliW
MVAEGSKSIVEGEMFTFISARFGELEVGRDTIIEFPQGLIGFSNYRNYVLLDHKEPFSWLHSIEEPSLAFVVIDGFQFGKMYDLSIPARVKECDFQEDDEYAILIVVTVRESLALTSANIKAPLFVNVRNRRGVQVICEDPKLSTRYLLWEGADVLP